MSANNLTLAWVHAHCSDFGECWLWEGPFARGQYPMLGSPMRGVMVRRHVWQIMGNELPDARRHVIKATCGERRCCNPAHLAVWSRGHLISDTYRTTRNAAAEYGARLAASVRRGTKVGSLETARSIRADQRCTAEVAAAYGLCESMVRKIKAGRSWREAAPNASVFTWRPER